MVICSVIKVSQGFLLCWALQIVRFQATFHSSTSVTSHRRSVPNQQDSLGISCTKKFETLTSILRYIIFLVISNVSGVWFIRQITGISVLVRDWCDETNENRWHHGSGSSEFVGRRVAESRHGSVFRETSWRLPHWWAISLSGLRAASGLCQSDQKVITLFTLFIF